jgi:magnesium-transporting ATPase (P-type)
MFWRVILCSFSGCSSARRNVVLYVCRYMPRSTCMAVCLGLPDLKDEGTMTLQNFLSYNPKDTEWHSRRHESAAPWWETLIMFLDYIALLRWETKFHTHVCRTYVCQIREQKNLNWTGFTFIVMWHTTACLRPVAWCHEVTQSLPAWVAALLVVAVPASCT